MKSLQHVHLVNTDFLRWHVQFLTIYSVQAFDIHYTKNLAYLEIVTIELWRATSWHTQSLCIQIWKLQKWCLTLRIKALNTAIILYMNSTNRPTNVSKSLSHSLRSRQTVKRPKVILLAEIIKHSHFKRCQIQVGFLTDFKLLIAGKHFTRSKCVFVCVFVCVCMCVNSKGVPKR